MTGLKRINDTKFPTEKQLKNIIHNLKTKHLKDKFVISSELASNSSTIFYSLYTLTNKKGYYPILGVGWSTFLEEYKNFMREENNE